MINSNSNWNPLTTNIESISKLFGTPAYIYNESIVAERTTHLASLFSENFNLSYAVKSNPNDRLLRYFSNLIDTYDVSSFGEVQRVIQAGVDPRLISFSGPAKRAEEIKRAIQAGVGELVLESPDEIQLAADACTLLGRKQDVLVRINPISVPRGFGASMSGNSSQFGIDEEQLPAVLPELAQHPMLNLKGFHIYTGSNCLTIEPIVDNFEVMLRVFEFAAKIAGIVPERLIFGSGFGVPYLPTDSELPIEQLAERLNTVFSDYMSQSPMKTASCSLELGRWLVAPAGLLLMSVVGLKNSRGTDICLCDAGFNNHLAAAGMMGSAIRRNWVIENLTSQCSTARTYNLVGPLCTSIDILARNLELPTTTAGDILAIPMSGAYGYSASPQKFISHPSPRELWLDTQGNVTDISEILENHWNTL